MSVAAMDLALALSAVFEEEQACESMEHSVRPEGHAGAAEWYLHVTCKACGHDVVKAYCAKFKHLMMLPNSIAICAECWAEAPAPEVVRSATKIRS